jgi:hypothetical protein
MVVDVQDLETPAKTYYRQCLQQQDMTPAYFKGVTLEDLVVLEQVFSLNLYVYDSSMPSSSNRSNAVCVVWYTPPGYL